MIIRQGLIIPVLISKAWIGNIFYFTRKTFTYGQGPATYHSTGIRQGLCFSQWSLAGTRFRFNRPILLSLGVLCLHLDSTILPKYIFFSHTHIVNYHSRQIISSQTRFHATHRKPHEFDYLNHCGPYSSQYRFHASLGHGCTSAKWRSIWYFCAMVLSWENQLYGLSSAVANCRRPIWCMGSLESNLHMFPNNESILWCRTASIGKLPIRRYIASVATLSGSPCIWRRSFL